MCLSFLFTTLDYEAGDFGGAVHCHSCCFQDQDHHQYQGKTSKCLLILFLSLSIMHVFTSEVLPKLDYQNYFWCGYYYYITIRIIIPPVVKTWCYQALSHHMIYLPSKDKTRESLSGHPKIVFLQNKGFKKKPDGKAEPCLREDFEEDHFWKSGCFKNDT